MVESDEEESSTSSIVKLGQKRGRMPTETPGGDAQIPTNDAVEHERLIREKRGITFKNA